jgi:peroxiredoxin
VKRNVLASVMVVVVTLGMIAFGKYLDRSRHHSSAKLAGDVHGTPAPDFDLATVDGRKVKLSELRGKAVLLNFWATWCPPCKVEMPWFVELQNQYGKDGLVVLGVAMDDSAPAKIAEFTHEMGVNYPVLLGTDQVSDDYGNVQYLPTTFYIDRNGMIVDKMAGLLSRKDIEDGVKKALSPTYRPLAARSSQAAAQLKMMPPKDAAQ